MKSCKLALRVAALRRIGLGQVGCPHELLDPRPACQGPGQLARLLGREPEAVHASVQFDP